MKLTLLPRHISPAASARRQTIASKATTGYGEWFAGCHRAGDHVAFSTRCDHLRSTLELYSIEAGGLAHEASYDLPASAAAVCLAHDGTIAVMIADTEPASQPTLILSHHERPPRTFALDTRGLWPRALRSWSAHRLLVLGDTDVGQELVLVDTETGAVVSRAATQGALCDGGYLPEVSSDRVLVHGHCGCQENDLEVVRLRDDVLASEGWCRHVDEGATVVAVLGDEVLVEELTRSGAMLRRIELASGRVRAERATAELHLCEGARRRADGRVAAFAWGQPQGAALLIDPDRLEVTQRVPLDEGLRGQTWLDDETLLARSVEGSLYAFRLEE